MDCRAKDVIVYHLFQPFPASFARNDGVTCHCEVVSVYNLNLAVLAMINKELNPIPSKQSKGVINPRAATGIINKLKTNPNK